ncbi:MAG: hypothetical protein FWE10_00320 [Rikenellaceae bacterium]|nr:hypothetical protein [Rikenellaceae bacterium]MCL2692184.1 hypothetical protein [Rikenellaceae bacterium]
MKKIICLLIAAAAFSTYSARAQDYNFAVGVRLGGDTGGASVKFKMNPSDALEGILSVPWDKGGGFLFTLLYERHIPVITHGFHLYYGAGGHIGTRVEKLSFGVDGILGLEYKLRHSPLAISLDYKPSFSILHKTKFHFSDLALGIRVAF